MTTKPLVNKERPRVTKPEDQPGEAHNQFAFMRSPGAEHDYEVGDTVEVFCDHEKANDRIRGWLKGIVVQWTARWWQFSSAPMST